jgi:ribonuclease D
MEQWIDDGALLARELEGLGAGPLAVDTEADSFHHYEPKLCLIQLSFGERDLLLDPLAGPDVAALRRAFEDPALRKVLHAADYDLRMLKRHLDLEICPVFDTMIAARLCGERSYGLAALLQKYLGVTLDKRYQMADWSTRPLSPGMRAYAARDTRYLIALAEILERRLIELGRARWAAEEFAGLAAPTPAKDETLRPAPYLRISGAVGLTRRELGVLRELAELRERSAASADVPPFRIANDAVLVAQARQSVSGPVPDAAGWNPRWASGVPAAIERALAASADTWPEPIEARRRALLDPELEARIRQVSRERDRLAGELGLDPTLIASRKQLEQALTSAERSRPLRAWQRELLGPILASVES